MKKVLGFTFLAILSATLLQAQTKITITASGNPMMGITPVYTPSNVTINQGDTILFKNIQGSHNVDGRQTTFAANPASFFSGAPASGWSYEFVFTVPGFYQFKCTQGTHATTQHGTVTVNASTGIDLTPDADISLYPNPANDFLYLRIRETLHHGTLVVRDMMGREVMNTQLTHDELQRIEIGLLPAGLYVATLNDHGSELKTQRLMITH
jgi:plastocyanin